ncbi:DUF4215 domain-containing protein [Cystobacter fuscus]|uniref:DUF4215 domain-containing protein n=1 Tax=Cystobacter fuscus TaxID=43 RepID=UPI002B2CCE31|nr:DUF4215 domain-containing protein [Cystobacter fuscus]
MNMHPKTAWTRPALVGLTLLFTSVGCQTQQEPPSATPALLTRVSQALVADGKLQPGEECDDGNTQDGDGCSATGKLEAGFLCHIPGKPCSLASLCGNGVVNSGELCDDGNTVDNRNGCSVTCDLSLCGNGTLDNRSYPNYAQEICDDGNRFDGDGCNRLCEVEPGQACAGSPSRCVRAGVTLFNTGVDANNRRLEGTVADPHWFYRDTTTGATTGERTATDWPQEVQTARFMDPLGASTCVYQDFIIPSTTTLSRFRMRVATFNDNEFEAASVNGVNFTPIIISQPAGQPWQKNTIRELGTTAPWRTGLNRLELCNENEDGPPNAFRYLFVDAYDDRCGDGVISPREECDDGNSTANDGCSATCGIEPAYGCTGEPSRCARTCGNGALNPGEQCDDGNLTTGDGCDARCRVEAGYACPIAGSACVQQCGDGVINPGELCDDGNTFNSDGCSAACRVENGYECHGVPSVCGTLCGNGRMDPGELCDDGNVSLGDGCSPACTLELGYVCPTAGAPCVKSCGNGKLEQGEQCDDGNRLSGDGCATECRVEPGYACSEPQSAPSACAETCGNGVLDANETCDDGNKSAGDGCSPGCRVDPGYSCSGTPSTCAALCGDGIVAGAEQCDHGNTESGDGCSSTCQIEAGWTCPSPGTVCTQMCGNGVPDIGEQCDDQNTQAGDGCGATCQQESGYYCSGAPSVCVTSCGDGQVAGTEACDDGNLEDGDACSPRCRLNLGQACTSSNDCEGVCNPATHICVVANVCGNGLTEQGETCDDANTASGDGCGAACAIEPGYRCQGQPSVCTSEPPDTTLVRGPPAIGPNPNAGFEFSSNDPGARFECSLDDGPYQPCEATYVVTPGQHTLRARAVDVAGNTDPTPVEHTWRVLNDNRSLAGGGCSAVPTPSVLGLLALLALRRRGSAPRQRGA